MAKTQRSLTQQQWTNLIIFVISALVILFIFVGKVMERNIEKQNNVDRSIELVRIDFGDFEVWREQVGWQSTSSQITSVEARAIADRWQSLMNQPGKRYTTLPPGGRTVLLYLTNYQQPVVCKILKQADSLKIAFITTQQLFSLPIEHRLLYFPEVN